LHSAHLVPVFPYTLTLDFMLFNESKVAAETLCLGRDEDLDTTDK